MPSKMTNEEREQLVESGILTENELGEAIYLLEDYQIPPTTHQQKLIFAKEALIEKAAEMNELLEGAERLGVTYQMRVFREASGLKVRIY